MKGIELPEAEPRTREVRGIASRVVLDRTAGTATKVYRRRLPIWVLYWIMFQAPFPYATNRAALNAAQCRRRIAGLITKHFFGRDCIAPVVAVTRRRKEFQFVTGLVDGGPPRDKHRARQFLHDVTQAFIETGLPTWQVSPHNPRVIGNLLETEDGEYWLIDLESNVVTPLVPLRELWGAMRQQHVPPFDDIDLPRLWRFIYDHWDELGESLGERDRDELVHAASGYQFYERLWQGAEPRIWSRALSKIAGFLDVPRHAKRLLLALPGLRTGGRAAEGWVRAGIERWREEGRITEPQAREAAAALEESDMLRLLGNLGVHMAISVPLRFPFGAIVRFSWTASHRLGAELRALFKRKADADTRIARSIHTLPVIVASAMPGVGVASYVLAAPLRRNQVLMAVSLDQGLRLLPFGLYRRMHVEALTTDLARAKNGAPAGLRRTLKEAPARLLGHADLIAGVLLLNAMLLGVAVGGTIYEGGTWFGEPGPVAFFSALQLAIAGALAVLAYFHFWKRRPAASDVEAARTFFWLATGAWLLWVSVDDFFHLHHLVTYGLVHLPIIGQPDNPIVIGYAVVALVLARVFWRHLLASPAQFALLAAAGVMGGATLAVDFVFAEVAPLDEVEDGLHLITAGMMVCAAAVGYRETVTPGAARRARFPGEEAGEALRSAFRPTARNVAHWVSWAVTLGILLTVTAVLMDGDVYGWEVDVTREIQSWGYPTWLFRITSEHLTNPMSHIGAGVLLGVAAALWFSGRRVESFIVLLIFPLHVLGNFPKALVERDRPSDVIDGITGVGGGDSFPSGHAEYVISFYGFLVFLALLQLRLGWQRALVVTAWLAFAVLCGVGRVANGRHWPVDVLTSYVTGIGLLSGLIWLYYSLRPLSAPRTAPGRPVPARRRAPRLSTHVRAG